MSASVIIREVGPRDGLQNEERILAVDERVALIDRLAATGLRRIEAVSFVRSDLVPQMAEAEEVMRRIARRPGVVYAGLALNERGAERAVAAGVDELRFVVAATESFNRRNQGMSVAENLRHFERAGRRARASAVRVTAAIAVAFGCPFDGPVAPGRVREIAAMLHRAGAQEIVLADTIGAAVPSQVTLLIEALRADLGDAVPLGGHFHNTRNTGLANAYAALQSGVPLLEASVGGIGGCPFAPRATGNIPTEDLVYMLRQMGIETGVDLSAVIATARWLEGLLGHTLPGMLMKADPFPESLAGVAAAGT